MPEVIDRLDSVAASTLKKDFSRVINDVNRQGQVRISDRNESQGILMSISQYEGIRAEIMRMEELVDHALLYVELNARGNEPDGKITLEALKEQYNL